MVFTTTALFKGIACPEGDSCRLTNCIYSHDIISTKVPYQDPLIATISKDDTRLSRRSGELSVEPAAKRRKVTYNNLGEKPPSKADLIRNQLAATKSHDQSQLSRVDTGKQQSLASLRKPVSPPPKSGIRVANTASSGSDTAASQDSNKQSHPLGPRKAQKLESLNPRLIAKDPAGHQKRSLYLKALHAEMLRMNQTMKDAKGIEFRHNLICTDQELISMALDAEEKTAREQPMLYANIIKQQVAGYRKMKVEEWGALVVSLLFPDPPKPAKQEEKVITTGLPLQQEHLILSQLIVDQKPLAAFGYVPKPPSEQEAIEAAAAVKASANYELCDRCAARFQVFPERNEEGQLTSNGPCKYHPYRKVFPQRAKTDKETGTKEPYYPCCNEPVGSPGCTRSEEHVFKASSPARLAAILPFVVTPDNVNPSRDRDGNAVKAVAFDCEMGYTAFGMELIRLTAVAWPSGAELIDVLVRPLGATIDLNSRFSGVFPEHFQNAIPIDEWNPSLSTPSSQSGQVSLPIVDSPVQARNLLCSFLQPGTPLIGHAIDNDLNTVRLCHPAIVDTVILFSHPRGLPMRFGLKMLAQRHLSRAIQQGGERGHDSKEDAIATGDLVRVKVGEKWRTLKASGWQILHDQLIPPTVLASETMDAQSNGGGLAVQSPMDGAVIGKKRKKRRDSFGDQPGGTDSETDES